MSLFTRIAFSVLLAAMPVGAGAQSTFAQAPADTFGDWLLRCATNDVKRCVLTQRIVSSESREVVAEIGIAPLVNGDDGFVLALNVPEGADLSAGPAFRLDGAPEQTAMAWRVCVNGMCQASASVSTEAAAEMDAAGRGVFGYKKYRASELTLTAVSYNGLAEGLAAMATK